MSGRSGSKTVTIKDVAREAGVALGTVSRIINGHDNVDPALRDSVLAAIAHLGYRRNGVARSMRLGRTHAVGCIVSDIQQPIAAAQLAAAETTLRDAGYALIAASTHYEDEREAQILSIMQDRAVDGLIVAVNRDEHPDTVERLRSIRKPVVLWERDTPGRDFDTALTAHRVGVRLATEHLLALGHRDIALVAGDLRTWAGREQRAGCLDALASAGLPEREDRIFQVGAFGDAERGRLLDGRPGPTAIIANINEIPPLLQACRLRDLSLPRDLSIVSIGDADILDVLTPAITAIRGDPSRIGQAAASLLIRRLRREPAISRERVLITPELVIRHSSVRPR